MRVASRTGVGLVREHNEDACLVDEQTSVFMVADGLGGHAAGEVASQMAVRAVSETLSCRRLTQAAAPAEVLGQALHAAHEVVETAAVDPSRTGMGTTAVVAYLPADEGVLWLAHVGDSRAYLVQAGSVHRLTTDDRLSELGGLTQALGLDGPVYPHTARVELQPDDRIVLCTDGLTDLIDDTTLAAVGANEPLQHCADLLVDEAMSRGGIDNVTLIVIDVDR